MHILWLRDFIFKKKDQSRSFAAGVPAAFIVRGPNTRGKVLDVGVLNLEVCWRNSNLFLINVIALFSLNTRKNRGKRILIK